MQLSVDPARPGANTLHLYLFDDAGRLTQPADIRVTLTEPEQQIGPLAVELLPAGPATTSRRHVGAGAGSWTLTVTVRLDEFTAEDGEHRLLRPLTPRTTIPMNRSSVSLPRSLARPLIVLVGVMTALAASVGVAAAHVTVSSPDAAPGGYGKITFRVPNESDTASTVSVRIQIPAQAAMASLSTQPVPGWEVTTTTANLPKPVENEGQKISTYVSVVEFRAVDGGGIAPGRVPGVLPCPAALCPTSPQVAFPVVQPLQRRQRVRLDRADGRRAARAGAPRAGARALRRRPGRRCPGDVDGGVGGNLRGGVRRARARRGERGERQRRRPLPLHRRGAPRRHRCVPRLAGAPTYRVLVSPALRRPRRRATLCALVVSAGLVLAGCGSDPAVSEAGHDHSSAPAAVEGPDDTYAGLDLAEPYRRPTFTLTDSRGGAYDFRAATDGRPTLLFFGYTRCPDVCPTTMADIAVALRGLDAKVAKQVQVVFVTTDPATTPPPSSPSTWAGSTPTCRSGSSGSPAARS